MLEDDARKLRINSSSAMNNGFTHVPEKRKTNIALGNWKVSRIEFKN